MDPEWQLTPHVISPGRFFCPLKPPNRRERKAAIGSPRVERVFFQLVTELEPQTLGWSLNNHWKGHVFTQNGHKELPRGRLLAMFDLIHVSSLQHHKNLDG